MPSDTNEPIHELAARTTAPLATIRSATDRVDDAIDSRLDQLSDRAMVFLGYGSLGVTGATAVAVMSSLAPTVAAQSAGQAEEVMCQTGAGEAITFGFGLIALLLLVVAGYRGAMGLNNMGSKRSDKKREGQDQIKGAGYSLGGVFALVAFPPLLEQFGLATISCVTFAPF